MNYFTFFFSGVGDSSLFKYMEPRITNAAPTHQLSGNSSLNNHKLKSPVMIIFAAELTVVT